MSVCRMNYGFAVALIAAMVSGVGVRAQDCETLADATHAPSYPWTTGGDTNWFAQTNVTRLAGSCAAQSGDVDDDEASWVETVVTNAGMITFYWKVSSEEGWDYLSFYVNGALSNEISGEVNWEQQQYDLADNVSTLRWTYSKDGSESEGYDAGWMTDFTFIPFTGRVIGTTGNLSFGKVGVGLSTQRLVTVKCKGDEAVTVSDIQVPAGYSVDSTSFVLNPGELTNVTVTFTPLAGIIYTGVLQVVSDTQVGTTELPVSGQGLIVADRFVWTNSPTPEAPYTNWATAAHTIQDALDLASEGDTVWVTNGVYDQGGSVLFGQTNRLVVGTGMVVRSVNGPAVTHIVGVSDLVTPVTNGCGPGAVRCVLLLADAQLIGFTVRDGHTTATTPGGGVFAEEMSGIVQNCVISGNAARFGGGMAGGYCNNSVIESNTASRHGGGTYSCSLTECTVRDNQAETYGGGVCESIAVRSRITGNSALIGGGCFMVALTNCMIVANSADYIGGGVVGDFEVAMESCTVVGNDAQICGGITEVDAINCIVYHNTASMMYPNWAPDEDFGSFLTSSCITPPADGDFGTNNIDADPRIVSVLDPHLLSDSPCMNAGSNMDWMASSTDIDGDARLNSGRVDIGADEYWANSQTDTLQVAIGLPLGSTVQSGYALPFEAEIIGRCEQTLWDMDDGSILTNEAVFTYAYTNTGDYEVRLTASNLLGEVSAVVTVHVGNVAYYVATNGSDAADGLSWDTAKETIQSAVDDCTAPGGTVWVSNGVYNTGGLALNGQTNRVSVTVPIHVRSVNGPAVTWITGAEDPESTEVYGCGTNAVRCAYLCAGASLNGFTLSGGRSGVNGGIGPFLMVPHVASLQNLQAAGGVYCEGTNSVVSNCVISACAALTYGGGIYGGTITHCDVENNESGEAGGGLFNSMIYHSRIVSNLSHYGGGIVEGKAVNCLIADNEATQSGGGADNVELINCTIIGNRAVWAGGVTDGSCVNTILYYNEAVAAPNWGSSYSIYAPDLSYCCTTPMPEAGAGNFTNTPMLSGVRNAHLLQNSPCVGAGITQDWMSVATDCDDEPRQDGSSVDIGWDQFWYAGCTNALDMEIGTPNGLYVAPGAALPLFSDDVAGRPLGIVWNFDDGDRATNAAWTSHAWVSEGDYEVRLIAMNQESGDQAAVTVHVANVVQYVAPDGNDAAAGTDWSTAKQTIQAAVDASIYGGLVLVSNGVYETGAHQYGSFASSNRVVLTNGVTVRSVNGPEVTVIAGQNVEDEGVDYSVRCLFMEPHTRLEGFSLTNGATGMLYKRDHGGGAYCMDATAVLSNCVASACYAYAYGGGVFQGTVFNSILRGNEARAGGGAYESVLADCVVTGNEVYAEGGGGLSAGRALRCEIVNNDAQSGGGGGVFAAMLSNCVVRGNSANDNSGGLKACTAWNSLIVENDGYGSTDSNLRNCTVSANGWGVYNGSALNSVVWDNGDSEWSGGGVILQYTCTRPLPTGAGCITNDPMLSADYELTAVSPCVNAGSNEAWMVGAVDLAGTNRIISGTVDMGAYEYDMTPGEFSAAFAGSGVALSWQLSVSVVSCAVYRAETDTPPADPIVFLGVTNDWTDTTTSEGNCYYYWIRAWVVGEGSPLSESVHYCVPVGSSGTHYVWAGSTTPLSPYTNWTTAATNIQDAVDVAEDGDTVLVGDGSYAYGWGNDEDDPESIYLKNRVFITNDITVRSVNGSMKTIIRGDGPNGSNAVRCVYMRGNSSLTGFMLTEGHVAAEQGRITRRNSTGGGLFMEENAVVSNCAVVSCEGSGVASWRGGHLVDSMIVYNEGANGGGLFLTGEALVERCAVVENSATADSGERGSGGGAYLVGSEDDGIPVLRNCFIADNESASQRVGGGAGVLLSGGNLFNCTIIGNRSMEFGGGLYIGASEVTQQVVNCISYHNKAPYGQDVYIEDTSEAVPRLNYNCASDALVGSGNITNDPCMVGRHDSHILAVSPCRGAGDPSVVLENERDIDGEDRLGATNQVDIGCDQFHPDAINGSLTPGYKAYFTNVVVGTSFTLVADNEGKADGFVWQYNIGVDEQRITNAWQVSPVFEGPGQYEILMTASNADGVFVYTGLVNVVASFTNYVSLTGSHTAPYTNWATAATNVQAAIDACYAGGVTLVNTGTYTQGSTIRIEKPMTLRSPEEVDGDQVILHGENTYGVLFMDDAAAIVELVALKHGNASQGGGALVYAGTLRDCNVEENTAERFGGGVRAFGDAHIEGCYIFRNIVNQFGGGVYADDRATVDRCNISQNTSREGGGGVWLDQDATLINSYMCDNRAYGGAGVAFYTGGTMRNCTITFNKADGYGGGVWHGLGTTRNSIVYYNEAPDGADNYKQSGTVEINYCLTTPGVTGIGNITDREPLLAGRLIPNILPVSPARNAGDSSGIGYGERDIDREQRVYEGTVDIGCDEVVVSNMVYAYMNFIMGDLTAVVNQPVTLWANGFGRPISLVWSVTGVGVTNISSNVSYITPSWSTPGDYPVTLVASNFGGVTAKTVTVHVVGSGFINYVSPSGLNISPYTNWYYAATNIQDAIDACAVGGTTIVGPGVYPIEDPVRVMKRMTLAGVPDETNVVVDANGHCRVMLVDHTNAFVHTLTLTDGADYNSAGLELLAGTVSNVTIVGNTASNRYGGANVGGSALLIDANIISNKAASYAGVRAAGNSHVEECEIDYNESDGDCAGLGLEQQASAEYCYMVGNIVHMGGGGGLYFNQGGTAEFCLMYSNAASQGAGAYFNGGGSLFMGIFEENWAFFYGGGAWLSGGGEMEMCYIYQNYALTVEPYGKAGGVVIDHGGTLRHCYVFANQANAVGGVYVQADGLIDDCMIALNLAANITIEGDVHTGRVGGVFMNGGRMTKTYVSYNVSQGNIGGVLLEWNGRIDNCVIENNSATGAVGGVSVVSSEDSDTPPAIRSSTITGNTASTNSGLYIENEGVVRNTIIYGNTAGGEVSEYAFDGTPDLAYCCTRPDDPAFTAVITNNPQFVDDNDCRLQNTSPCINTGTNEAGMTTATDFAGNSRLIGATVDMGAYEYLLPPASVMATRAGRAIRIGWPLAGGEQGIEIYRSATPDGEGVLVGTVGAGVTNWTDTTLTNSQTFYYTIRAFYGEDSSEASTQIGMLMPAAYLDFDGDTLADIAVYAPDNGMWYILQSTVNTGRFQAWGWNEAMPVPGDYDGDGLNDVAVYSFESGTWLIWQSATQTARVQAWGWNEAWPVPADYDGDGLTDVAVYVPENGTWLIWQSATQTLRSQAWGWSGAYPVPADYDGDGLTDLAVYAFESGTWLIWQSSTQTARVQAWGWEEIWPLPGDYDGDGLTDVAVYDPEGGVWLAWLSASQSMMSETWGWSAAWPVPADYDGDGKYDRTVYAPSFGMWYLWQSGSNTSRMQPWGFEEADPVN